MRYNLTLKKDLPDFPAGTVFKLYKIVTKEERDGSFGNFVTRRYNQIGTPNCHGGYDIIERPVGDFVDDPSWFEKTVDNKFLSDLKCPKCGETKGNFFSTKCYCSDMDSYKYGVQYSVGFECLCGHKRILYGTEYGNEKLQKEMEQEN